MPPSPPAPIPSSWPGACSAWCRTSTPWRRCWARAWPSAAFGTLPLTCQWLALTRARLGRRQPLIGINGAQDGRDMARMLLAGASAVGFASAVMLRGYEVIGRSLGELDAYLAGKGLTAEALVGRAADARRTFADMPLRRDHWRGFVPVPTPAQEETPS